MLMDCDGFDDKNKCVRYLNNRNIETFEIESSPGHYWVVGNVVDTPSRLTYFMEEIPGIDKRYTSCSRDQSILLFQQIKLLT